MMSDYLGGVLSADGFLPHGVCISWSPALVSTYVLSDVVIFLSYFSMPLALGYFSYQRKDFPYRWLLILFAVFIMSCGLTHLMGVVVLWQPLYWLDASLKAMTAVISALTALVLWPLMPHALRLPSPSQLQALNAQLQAVIEDHQRTEALLRVANQELDDFAYAVSHDLRAPLRAMKGFSNALEEDYGAHLDATAKGYLQHIAVASTNMSNLIDGLLTLSRSTRKEIVRERVDLTAMAERIRDEFNKEAPERQIEWKIEPQMSECGDANMLESVMRNLIGNAWKFTSKTAQGTIRIYSQGHAGQPFICVSDNGAGFDMAHAAQLFTPFRRLHRQEEFPGIGIGLATVKRIVSRHGGVIEAESQPGLGATFRFALTTRY